MAGPQPAFGTEDTLSSEVKPAASASQGASPKGDHAGDRKLGRPCVQAPGSRGHVMTRGTYAISRSGDYGEKATLEG